jgi:CRP-like cAMP-binding protein
LNPVPKKTDALQLIKHYNLAKTEVAARTVLLHEGEKAHKIYFIEKGCVRMWFNNNGTDITTQFFFEGSVVASSESLITGAPSDYTMETLEPCTLYVMPKVQFMELQESDPDFKDWFNSIILNRFFYYSKHVLSYLKNKPQERYNELLASHPQIFLRVPQHYIASYLGITAVSLSRIRNRKV